MNETEFNEFKELLGLSEECIEVDWMGFDTGIEWNEQTQCWEIEYHNLGADFQLIHELGHVFLKKKINYDYVAKKPPRFNDILFHIWWCHNAIEDCLVNYGITRLSEIYNLYKIYISAVISRDINPPELYMWFGGYIEYYLSYNFNLNEEDKQLFETNYSRFLDKIKTVIIHNTRLENNQFDQIDSALNDFGNISSTEDPNEIKNFDFEILKLFPLADISTLRNQFTLMYPNL